MTGFTHAIAGGSGKLVVRAFLSPNYVQGVSGWAVFKDGSAEFNNVTVRGTIIAGQFIGTGEGKEVIIYAGLPAADNVVASVISAAATDSHGNDLLIGTTSYHKFAANSFGAANVGGGFVTFYTSAVGMNTWSPSGSLEAGSFTDIHGKQNVVSAPGGMLIGSLGIDSSGIVQTALTATAGTAAQPTLITTDTWHAITLDAGWIAGTPAPSYQLLPNGWLGLTGVATHAAITTETAINNGNPLPAQYRPATNKNYQGNRAGGTAGALIKTTGVLFAEPNGVSSTSVDITGAIPLDL